VSALDASANEGAGTIYVPIPLDIPSPKPVVVKYRTVDGSALAGVDYTAASGQFTANTTSSITIPILNDTLGEGSEWFKVEITEATNSILRRSYAIVTIVDNDTVVKPLLTVSDVQVLEGNNGTTAVKFDLKLLTASASRVVVRYAATDESAKAPDDYVAASGEVVFDPGQTSKQVSVLVKGDTAPEPDETFLLRIETSDALLDRSAARCTIRNDDFATTRRRSAGH